jgi:hypothetical protein
MRPPPVPLSQPELHIFQQTFVDEQHGSDEQFSSVSFSQADSVMPLS